MKIITDINSPEVMSTLKGSGLIIARTDTIYGILVLASDKIAIKKLYEIKHRPLRKPCIVLVSDVKDIPNLTMNQRKTYQRLCSERPTTIISKVSDDFLPHLAREGGRLGFRVIAKSPLSELISRVGPLVAPSANPSGLSPAQSIDEAIDYFSEEIDLYINGGRVVNTQPSRIMKFNGSDQPIYLRS